MSELVLPSGNGWLLIAGQIACTSAGLLSEFSLEARSYREGAKALLITIATAAASVPSLGANSNWRGTRKDSNRTHPAFSGFFDYVYNWNEGMDSYGSPYKHHYRSFHGLFHSFVPSVVAIASQPISTNGYALLRYKRTTGTLRVHLSNSPHTSPLPATIFLQYASGCGTWKNRRPLKACSERGNTFENGRAKIRKPACKIWT